MLVSSICLSICCIFPYWLFKGNGFLDGKGVLILSRSEKANETFHRPYLTVACRKEGNCAIYFHTRILFGALLPNPPLASKGFSSLCLCFAWVISMLRG